jgi:hypothetical protein
VRMGAGAGGRCAISDNESHIQYQERGSIFCK